MPSALCGRIVSGRGKSAAASTTRRAAWDRCLRIETRYYVTDITVASVRQGPLPRHVGDPRSSKNGLHSGCDAALAVSFDEGRSRTRASTLQRVLATLGKLVISTIRHAASRSGNIGATTCEFAREPGTVPDLLSSPQRLCK